MNTLWFSYGVGGTAIVSQAEILGNKELHLKSGSDINLTCIVRQTPEPPTYIYWYHGSRVINYSQRGGKKLVSQRLLSSFSLLLDYLLHWDHYSMLIDHFLVSWNVTVEKAIFMGLWHSLSLTAMVEISKNVFRWQFLVYLHWIGRLPNFIDVLNRAKNWKYDIIIRIGKLNLTTKKYKNHRKNVIYKVSGSSYSKITLLLIFIHENNLHACI